MRAGRVLGWIGYGLAVLALAGCVSGGDDGYVEDFGPPPAPGDDGCAYGCNWLTDCNWCDQDENGNCLTPTQCASRCRAEELAPVFECLAGLDFCDAVRIDGCYAVGPDPEDPPAPGDDGCANGCNTLRACGDCILDDAEECLSAPECAEACRADGLQDAYQCGADSAMCGGLPDECFDVEPPPDGPCQLGCDALDACGTLCPDPEDEACVTVEACVDDCEATQAEDAYACIAEAECDAATIEACRMPAVGDACEMGCMALDACELCIPGDDGECLSVAGCAEDCRADDSADVYACYVTVEMCDEAGFAACEELTPDTRCATGCEAMAECAFDCGPDGCTSCGGDDEPPCPTVEACVEACEAAEAQGTLECLGALEGCDLEATVACRTETGTCAVGCEQLDACGYCFTGPDEECLSVDACVTQCEEGAVEDRAIELCLSGLPMCDDALVDACFEAEADACAVACLTVEECGTCAPGDEGCLSAAECADWCRADRPDFAACVEAVEACDAEALGLCIEPIPNMEPEPEPDPEPTCADACESAAACDPCIAGDEEGCLGDACAALCASAADQVGCIDMLAACGMDPAGACAP